MRLSLRVKLFLVLLIVTTVAVAGTWLFMQRAFESGFVRLVEARQRERVEAVTRSLGAEYQEAGGWQRVTENRRRWVRALMESRGRAGREPRWARRAQRESARGWPPPGPGHRRGHKRRPGRTPLEFRMMLLDTEKRVLVGRPDTAPGLELHAIDVGGTTVGYLGVTPGPALNEMADIEFVSEQKRQFFAIAGIVVLVVAALALPLAGGMTRRIRRIASGARALAAGRYETRVQTGARDELGSLAGDFNELARALDAAEQSRRQWVADVSHELRTPLAVLRAELEALQDGVREPDDRSVHALHGEVMRLSRLVDDLYDLSLTDVGALSYRKEDVDPLDLLQADLDGLSSEFLIRKITVEWERDRAPRTVVHADPDRLSQLWSNLLVNALRHTDPGGTLKITASKEGRALVLDFADSAPGVPREELERLFERFHRAEKSRGREHGGAGLGLAICRSIVSAHDGTIEARPSPLGGLWIQVRLPTL